jgi:putative heme transporter
MSSGSHALDRAAAIAWRLIVIGAAVVLFGMAFERLQVLFLAVIVALFLATLLIPPANWLEAKGVPRTAATWMLILGGLGALTALFWALAPTIADQFADLGPTLEEGRETIEDWLQEGPLGLSESELERYTEQALDAIRGSGEQVATGVMAGAVMAIEIVVGFLLMLVLTFFFVKDARKITDWALSHVREQHHDLARALGGRAWFAGGGYVRGTAIVALVDAIGIGVGLAILGVPLVLPLAILTFFGGFFPLVGATVAGGVAVLVALVDGGLTLALLTLGVVLIVQQTESNLLEPLVLSRAIKIHPIGVLGALTAGGLLGGIVGAFLAVPTAAVIVACSAELRARDIIGPNASYKRRGRPDASPAENSTS